MISKRETVLQQLLLTLQSGFPEHQVLRNQVIPSEIPANGLLILRDGAAGEPTVLLSPPVYLYRHQAELELYVQAADGATRDQLLDQLLVRVGAVLTADPSLKQTVDLLHFASPQIAVEAVEGAPAIKGATVIIYLEYASSHPLASD